MAAYRRVLWFGLVICLTLGLSVAAAAPPHQQDSRLQYGDVVRGQISNADAEENWLFTGRAGDLILIDMQADNPDNLDPYLTLLDGRGNTILSDDDSGEGLNSRIGPLELPDDGEYTIVASPYSGAGEYTLQLMNLNTVPAIKAGKSLVGVTSSSHPNDYFLLVADGEADELFRLHVSDDERSSDPILSLYGPNGLITSTEYQDEGTIDPLVPVPGETYVIVVGWNPISTGGPYELSLSKSEVELLQEGERQTGTLDYEVYNQHHYFRGETGQSVRVTVTVTQGNIALALSIMTTDYDRYLFSGEGEVVRDMAVLLTLPRDTVYAIEVRDGSYQGETGSYEISLEWVEE